VALPSQPQSSERERRFERKPSHSKHFRTEDGFDLDARVFIAEGDDVGRERLIRYCARPAIVLERLKNFPTAATATVRSTAAAIGRIA